jgi:hypothetical protein
MRSIIAPRIADRCQAGCCCADTTKCFILVCTHRMPHLVSLEVFSKILTQQNDDTAEVNQAQEIDCVALVAHDQAAEVLQPGEEAFDLPAAAIAPEWAAILGFAFPPTAMGRNQLDPIRRKCCVKRVAVVGAVADHVFRPSIRKPPDQCIDNKGDFMRLSRVHVNGDRKTKAVCNGHALAAFAAFGRSHKRPPFFAGTKVPSMKHSDKSRWPRAWRSRANAIKMASRVPFATHSWSRR